MQNRLLLLLFCQQEDAPTLFCTIVLLDWERKLLPYIQAAAAKDLKIGLAAARGYVRHLHELHACQPLGTGRLDLPSIEGLKVVQVAQLARLADSFAAGEPLVTKEPQAVIHVVKVAHEEQYGTDCRPCAALSRVAVDDDHVLRIRCLHKFNSLVRSSSCESGEHTYP